MHVPANHRLHGFWERHDRIPGIRFSIKAKAAFADAGASRGVTTPPTLTGLGLCFSIRVAYLLPWRRRPACLADRARRIVQLVVVVIDL